ncbi:MAG: HAD-IC family P-type ATPase [Candidatus Falkowbacteria bacterium]
MINFYNIGRRQAFKELKSSSSGLTNKEADSRLLKFGSNKLAESKVVSRFHIFISQFLNPLIFILLLAGVISFFVKEYTDAGVILVAVLINTIIGYFQENKANQSLNQLKKIVEHHALVVRDGSEMEIDSVNLVPGDIIILQAGQKVPADARMIECVDLQVNEAALTGESVPVFKTVKIMPIGSVLADRKNIVYSATEIVGGTGRAMVVATGESTEIGQISKLVMETKEVATPLQNRLFKFSRLIGMIVGLISVLIVIFGVIQKRNLFDIFVTAIAVAVAAIPEGLAVAVTVILALGMKQILKKKALTRKLLAAETLGSITVICSDKTGTLTEGKMRVAHIFAGGNELAFERFDDQDKNSNLEAIIRALEIGIICNNSIVENATSGLVSEKIIGQPTEVALILASLDLGLDRSKLLKNEPRIGELPFNSDNKFMITLHNLANNGYIIYEKGAPEKLLAKSSFIYINNEVVAIDKKEKDLLLKKYEEFTAQGLRVIGVAYREMTELPWALDAEHKEWEKIDSELVFVGLIAFKDPLRAESRAAISECRRAGIRPIIITGDHKLTAHAIAAEAGIHCAVEDVITGDILDKVDDVELKVLVKKHNIFARVSPHHKLRIVEALRANGEVVAMTGDGLNDSPALKAANIGVCLGSGTEVAKETSDLVLLDNNFQVIVSAIEEGRIIFQNIRKSITYLISDSFSEIVLIAGSIFLGMPLALLPTQILWINIINDGFPNFSLAFERSDKNIMDQKPINPKEPLVNREMKIIIVWFGLIRDLTLLAIFVYLYRNLEMLGWDIGYLRTLFFAILGFKSLTGIFSLRSFILPIWKINHLHNVYLLGALFISMSLLILAIYLPFFQSILQTEALNFNAWLLILSVAFTNILVMEFIKYFFIVKRHA